MGNSAILFAARRSEFVSSVVISINSAAGCLSAGRFSFLLISVILVL